MIEISKKSGIYTLKTVKNINTEIDKAWEFFSSPKNLSKITPNNMGFKITSDSADKMYPGQIISYKVSPFPGLRMNWVTEITHVNNKVFFVDEQRFGPYKMWHHEHLFLQKDNYVEMTDKVSFKLPLGFIGRTVAPFLVIPKLKNIFNYRNQKIEQIFNNE